MIKGMNKSGFWVKIKEIDKINKDEYLKFEVTTCEFDELMKVLNSNPKPEKTSNKTTTKRVNLTKNNSK